MYSISREREKERETLIKIVRRTEKEKNRAPGDRETERITNSTSSLKKLFKNEMQELNNYKKVFECVKKKIYIYKQFYVNTSTDKTYFKMLINIYYGTNTSFDFNFQQQQNIQNVKVKWNDTWNFNSF